PFEALKLGVLIKIFPESPSPWEAVTIPLSKLFKVRLFSFPSKAGIIIFSCNLSNPPPITSTDSEALILISPPF
ncbi:MAG: hypothetical protein AAFR37_22205, partial [Cyanobacteria bacterium J06628_3]